MCFLSSASFVTILSAAIFKHQRLPHVSAKKRRPRYWWRFTIIILSIVVIVIFVFVFVVVIVVVIVVIVVFFLHCTRRSGMPFRHVPTSALALSSAPAVACASRRWRQQRLSCPSLLLLPPLLLLLLLLLPQLLLPYPQRLCTLGCLRVQQCRGRHGQYTRDTVHQQPVVLLKPT
jgi:hypothetical protein